MNGRSPYVGPRAYRMGEQLFGRDGEARELERLLVAERIVLLYSPSGAGKTSLLVAKVLTDLHAQDFQILRPARVAGARVARDDGGATNPYVASVLSYWEEGCPPGTSPIGELHGIDLNSYLTQRSWIRDNPASTLLVFDQFEEILTQNVRDREARADFFRQLGAALQDRDRWAIIAMREEHIAGLDPYLDLLPTRLATRYRLSLLDPEKAEHAIAGPARLAGVTYQPEALRRLVTELTIVRENGAEDYCTDYVEPLHLQVACERLWHRLPPGTTEVLPDAVDTCGTVSEALAAYYRDAVRAVASARAATGAQSDEATIRTWFENELIAASGLRDQVQRGAQTTGSLPNECVDPLEASYLVRSELRRGTTWYEISHDRLIEAIRADNLAWFEERAKPLALLRRRAREYSFLIAHGRQEDAKAELLLGEELATVEKWAESHPTPLSPQDAQFLEASRSGRTRARSRQLVLIVVSLIAVILFGSWLKVRTTNNQLAATVDRLKATNLELKATNVELRNTKSLTRVRKTLSDAATARWRSSDHELATLLSLQAQRMASRTKHDDRQLDISLDEAVRGALQVKPFALSPPLDPRLVGGVFGRRAFAPDGSAIAVETAGGRIATVPLKGDGRPCVRGLSRTLGPLLRLEYSPHGRFLLATTEHGLEIFRPLDFGCTDQARPNDVAPMIEMPATNPVVSCAIDDDGVVLVGDGNTVVRLSIRNDGSFDRDVVWSDPSATIARLTAMACAPDGSWLIVGSGSGQMMALLEPLSRRPMELQIPKSFSDVPDAMKAKLGYFLDRGVSALVPWHDRALFAVFRQGPVAVVILPDHADKPVRIVDLLPTHDSEQALENLGRPRQLAKQPIHSRGAFDANRKSLVVGDDRTIGIWHVDDLFADPKQDAKLDLLTAELAGDRSTVPNPRRPAYVAYTELRAPRMGVEALGFFDDGTTIAAADGESSVRLWLRDGPVAALYTRQPITRSSPSAPASPLSIGVIYALKFSGDGRRLAVGGSRYSTFVDVPPASLKVLPESDRACVPGSVRSIGGGKADPWLAWAVQKPNDPAIDCGVRPAGARNAVWIAKPSAPEDPLHLELPDSDGLWGVALSLRHHLIAAGDYGGQVWLWARDPVSAAPIQRAPTRLPTSNSSRVYAVAFHPTAPLLAVGREKGPIEVWSMEVSQDGKIGASPIDLGAPASRGPIRTVAFSPDGRALVIGDDTGTLTLLSLKNDGSWAFARPVFAHSTGVTSLAFCDADNAPSQCDPAKFASGGNDGSVKLWRITDGEQGLQLEPGITLDAPAAAVLSVALSPDGEIVAAGDAAGGVHIWPLDPKRVIDAGCAVVRRNLSREEWTKYFGTLPYECTCPNLLPGAQVSSAELSSGSDCRAAAS